jgi:hypothetical protein
MTEERFIDMYKSAGVNLLTWFEGHKPEDVHPSKIEDYMREYCKRHLEVDKLLMKAYMNKELTEQEFSERCQSLDAIMADFTERIKKRRGTGPSIEEIIRMMMERGGGGGFFMFGGGPPPGSK